ncbi:TolC family protein [uncultured Desulfobacter sp.]|uniref:TolC family protein n=1 Tax=uncultured Desulfobacter sp. TaxID=240139 RepID=UPI0029F58D44|nr:TolC family protein [uncultured Desulfobacter sp.]
MRLFQNCRIEISKIVLVFFLWLLPAGAAPGKMNKPEPLCMDIPYGRLTLTQAQQMALSASPRVAEMLARINQAQAVCDQARADLWPTVTVHAGYDWQNQSIRPDWHPEIRVEESLKHQNTGIQINWLLFDGFSRQASILAAKAGTKAAEEMTEDVRRLLAKSVAGAYYQAQLAAEGMQIAKQNSLFNQNLARDAEKRFLAGAIPQAEYLNFNVKSLQAENSFLKAEQYYSVVCIMLAKLLARPDSRLAPDMYPMAEVQSETLDQLPIFEDEFAYAINHRPDLLLLDAKREALLQKKRQGKAAFYPKIFVTGSYDYDEYQNIGNIDQNEHGSAIGFSLNWDLFDGGRRLANIDETQTRLLQVKRQKQQKILEIQAALHQALVKVRFSQAVYQRERYTLKLVKQIRDHVERSYRVGVTTLTRLNEAQTDLVTVQASIATSRINCLLHLESLRAESGRILDGIR